MIDDEGESGKWRDYAVQHLGVSASSGDYRDEVIGKLMRTARSAPGGLRGTAMRQLNRLEADGGEVLDPGMSALVIATARDDQAELSCRMTAVSLIGERQDAQGLAIVLELVGAADPALRRTAIAALGLLGGREDDERIRRSLADPDPMVVRAAQAAAKRLATPVD